MGTHSRAKMVQGGATGLPFLPGNTFSDVTKNNHSKRQIFNKAANGIQVIRDVPQSKPSPPVVPPPPDHSPAKSEDVHPAVPAYVALDRMVLRFFGYYKEAVHESRMENYRVRKVTILYYLEYNTLQVNEPKEENSGIPQGAFVKRHHIPKGRGEFYTVLDFKLGVDCTFYARTFRIVDCDAFTAQFFQENGLDLGEPEDYPYNPFDAQYTVMKQKEVENRGMSSVKTDDLMHWTEAMLGKPTNLINEDKLAQFLKYDRRVLRFYALWTTRHPCTVKSDASSCTITWLMIRSRLWNHTRTTVAVIHSPSFSTVRNYPSPGTAQVVRSSPPPPTSASERRSA